MKSVFSMRIKNLLRHLFFYSAFTLSIASPVNNCITANMNKKIVLSVAKKRKLISEGIRPALLVPLLQALNDT